MSSTNVPNPLPLFNNNKSLYGSRTQTNQSSKKISIIEDKTTLEPVRSSPLSPIIPSTNSNINAQRSIPITNPSTSSEFSSSHIQKQIHIQKQALHLFDLEQVHDNIQQQLDDWKNSMYNQVQSMKIHMLKQNAQSFEQLIKFQNLSKKLLEETLIKQLLIMKNNPQSINSEQLDEIEQHLQQMNNEIELMKQLDIQFDPSNIDITGELQLHKMTDFSKHQPLPQPPRSPPPLQSIPSMPDKTSDHTPTSPDPTEHKPTAPVWTDTTRQGLNSLSRYLPFRLLIPNYVREELIRNFDIEQFNAMLEVSCQSSIECILTIINQNDLEASIDILTDLLIAFKCSSTQYELRLLFQKKFLSIIAGKRNERLDRLREKYQLDMVKIFPQTCPQSDERVVLLRSQHNEYIIYCLREILQNVLEQAHFTDEDNTPSYSMYDPSVNYDESSAHEYGGYKSNDVCEITSNTNITASLEDLTESKQQSTVSIHSSSSSSLSKQRNNSEEAPLNFDDTEPESDDNDDEFKRSKSSDDKRIFVKKLNSVKGRQVGLLIGPFGQHITQIREQTGAKIHLTNDDNEPSVIKGTKSQINQALRLIRECLQTQKPIPRTAFKGGRRR
ncbi:unnamed protein product [Adineta steineri]|uniref:K Homology domain-containing protein n=1 Tax=Adineta steineri TaxID=433720 RepID=A0A813PTW8_9BILA|nr:unnamed protein product [Adineta steineri]